MGSVYVLVMIAALSSHCSAYAVSSVILKEGQSAEISCMTKGTGDYFWRKGETLHNSTFVAFFTVGEVSDDFQPYSVTENGTLHIRSVTLKDEGNYFCRVSSAENECYGEVKILVQASLRNFDLTIDRCDGESGCLLYLDPSQPTSLTCTALNAAPLMTLKWFNGAKEITEGIEQNEILTQNGNSREITSTVTAVYGHPASLTCQAVDPKRSNDDVRFAHAQVEMTVPVHESLATWIIIAGTLAGCFIVYVIFSLIKAWANRKKYKTKKEENVRLLTVEEGQIAEISKLKKEKDDEISRLKKEKDDEISRLKKEKDDETSRLKKEKDDETSRLKKEKNDEISRLKDKLRPKEEELGKCMNDIIELQQTIKAKINAAEKAIKENITAAEKTIKASITAAEGKLKQKEAELKEKDKENIKLQGNLTEISNKLGEIQKTLDKLKSSGRSSNNK